MYSGSVQRRKKIKEKEGGNGKKGGEISKAVYAPAFFKVCYSTKKTLVDNEKLYTCWRRVELKIHFYELREEKQTRLIYIGQLAYRPRSQDTI